MINTTRHNPMESGRISKCLFNGGYVSFSTLGVPTFYFYVKDHLGNVREVVTEDGTDVQVTQYYPFGGVIGDISTGPTVQRFKYNGKEFDRENGLDWLDYGARPYAPDVPRFIKQDMMAEKYYNVSPYMYCVGNPVRFIDLDGMDWITATYEDDTFVFFDSRISNQEDIDKIYGAGNSIRYVGKSGVINQKQSDGNSYTIYNLNADGSFDLTEKDVINSQYLHIGNDLDLVQSGNYYGVYLGPNNPQKKGKDFYDVPPIDRLDYSAYLHDKGYDQEGAKGIKGALFSTSVLSVDARLSGEAMDSFSITKSWNSSKKWALATGVAFWFISSYKNVLSKISNE